MIQSDVCMTALECRELASTVSHEAAAVLAHMSEDELRRLLAWRRAIRAGLYREDLLPTSASAPVVRGLGMQGTH